MIFHINTRKFWGFFLILCALTSSLAIAEAKPAGQSEGLSLPVVKRDALLNGLQILTLEKAGSGSVSLKVHINSGAMFDLVGKGGLADITAGMLLRGGGGYTGSAIEETLKQFALQINVSVNWDATDIEISGPADATDEMFDLLSRLVLTPTFEQKEFEAYKASRLAAIKSENSDKAQLARKAMETVFQGHPYGKPISGTAESLQQLTRFDLSYYHKKFYLANNSMLMVTGDTTAEAVTKLARSKFGAWRKGEVAPPSFQPPASLMSRKVIVLDKPEAQTAQALIAQVGFSRRSSDYLAAMVMSLILRNQFEKALAGVGEIQFDPRILSGPITMRLTSPASEIASHIDKAMQTLTRFQSTAPSVEEVESAKAQLITQMAELLKANPGQAFFDIELYGLGRDYLVTFVERVKALTPADVQRSAQAYLKPKGNAIIIAAPAKVYESEWKKLGDVIVTP